MTEPGFAHPLKRPAVDVKRLPDGGFVFRSPYRAGEPATHVGAWLSKWADAAPDRVFLSESRAGNGTRNELSYGKAHKTVEVLAVALERRLGASVRASGATSARPAVVLAGNGIDNALFQLAAMDACIPVVPLDPALAERPGGADVLRRLLAEIQPALVFADSGKAREAGLTVAAEAGAEIMVAADPLPGMADFRKLVKKPLFGRAPHRLTNGPTPETVAKIHFIDENTADFQGIVAFQAALTGNQEALAAIMPPLTVRPPVVIDDTPWWRIGGGTWAFNAVLRNGGSLHIGRPDGVTDLRPTHAFLEADALDDLLPALEYDTALRQAMLAELDMILVVAGVPAAETRARIDRLAIMVTGRRIPIFLGYGAPGTATLDTALYFDSVTPANIGLPVPGTFVKLAPLGVDLELRVKPDGPAPHAWSAGRLTPRILDEDGYLATGEAVRLIDPARPFHGIQRLSRPAGVPLQ